MLSLLCYDNTSRRPVRRLFIALLIVLFAVFIRFFCFPFHISKQFNCAEIKLDDPSFCKLSVVTIKGTYQCNLFNDDTFDGQIIVSSIPDTQEGLNHIHCSSEFAPIFYTKTVDNELKEFCLGKLVSRRLFSKYAILVFSGNLPPNSVSWDDAKAWGSWSSISGYCIVPNCTDYLSAEKALTSLGVFK